MPVEILNSNFSPREEIATVMQRSAPDHKMDYRKVTFPLRRKYADKRRYAAIAVEQTNIQMTSITKYKGA